MNIKNMLLEQEHCFVSNASRLLLLLTLFPISSKFDFFIGVDIPMCHALTSVKEIRQSLT